MRGAWVRSFSPWKYRNSTLTDHPVPPSPNIHPDLPCVVVNATHFIPDHYVLPPHLLHTSNERLSTVLLSLLASISPLQSITLSPISLKIPPCHRAAMLHPDLPRVVVNTTHFIPDRSVLLPYLLHTSNKRIQTIDRAVIVLGFDFTATEQNSVLYSDNLRCVVGGQCDLDFGVVHVFGYGV